MKRFATTAMILLTVFSLAGCKQTLPTSQYDACAIYKSWVSGGSQIDRAKLAALNMEEVIENEADGPVTAAVFDFIAAVNKKDSDMILTAGVQLDSQCNKNGWEPIEG